MLPVCVNETVLVVYETLISSRNDSFSLKCQVGRLIVMAQVGLYRWVYYINSNIVKQVFIKLVQRFVPLYGCVLMPAQHGWDYAPLQASLGLLWLTDNISVSSNLSFLTIHYLIFGLVWSWYCFHVIFPTINMLNVIDWNNIQFQWCIKYS